MSGSRHRIRRPFPGARKGLGLALVWLNLVVTPCAFALEADHGCPHMPPAEMAAMSGHHDHGAMHQAPACSSLQSECCDVATASVDSRLGKLESGGAEAIAAVPFDTLGLVDQQAGGSERIAPRPPDVDDHSPPRHVLFCVYLD